MVNNYKPVAFLGVGVFAEMILKEILRQGFLNPADIIASVRRSARAETLTRIYGVRVETENFSAVRIAKTVLVCVRPYQFEELMRSLPTDSLNGKLLISIMAGVSLVKLRKSFGSFRVIRANPNPQIETGFGYTAMAAFSELSDEDRQWAGNLFSTIGDIDWLEEPALDAISALSGVAHVLYFYEALVDAGIYLGLSAKTAKKVAHRSIKGAMMLLEDRNESAVDLIREATTPGGIGVEKLFELEMGGFRATILRAMRAACNKAANLRPDQ